METKKLYEIIGQSGHFYSDQVGYIKNDCNMGTGILFECSIYRTITGRVSRNLPYEYVDKEERRNCNLELSSIYKKVANRYDRITAEEFLDDKIETFYASVWDSSWRQECVNPNNPFKIEFKSFSIYGIPVSDMDGFRRVLKSLVYVLPEKYAEEPLYDYEARGAIMWFQ